MHLLGRTSFIDFPAPSSATLLLSFLFSLLLLSIIRITFLVFSSISAVSTEKEKLTQRSHSAESVQARRRWPLNIRLPSMRWSWKWESLPLSFSTPFSFSGHAIIGGVIGNGAGVSTPVPPTMTTNLQLKCAGPAFEHPRQSQPWSFFVYIFAYAQK